MRLELAIIVIAVAVLVVACIDLADEGRGRTTERRTTLSRIGGAVVVVSLAAMGADWLAEHAVRSVGGATATSDWITASAAVVEQLLRLISGIAGLA